MTAWIKGNKIELSIVLLVSFIFSVVVVTLTYAEKQAEQNAHIDKNEAAIAQNSKDICELAEMVKKHIEASSKAAETTVKMKTDVDYIKSDIREIKYMLRGYTYEEGH